ncbi:MAG TPA: GWxTD domain-containing protein [Thermoanaerobaculia bacterium]|nr:GWxTD domain-containing protein [Thermoanaerobaculia bacterium]
MRPSSAPSWATSALLALLALACSSTQTTPGLRVWLEGPVRWLMLADEERDFRGVANNPEALKRIDDFWRRRDPTPEDSDNPFRMTFQERTMAADRLYSEGTRRGSLTDRGRVLLLLGPPPVLRFRQRAVPSLGARDSKPRAGPHTRWLGEEIWGYPLADLPPQLAEALAGGQRDGVIEFVFATEGRHTYLVAGEGYCELAAKAMVRPDAR